MKGSQIRKRSGYTIPLAFVSISACLHLHLHYFLFPAQPLPRYHPSTDESSERIPSVTPALNLTSPTAGNPTLLSQNTATKLVFSSNGMEFELPTSIDWARSWRGFKSQKHFDVVYVRDATEIQRRGEEGNCTGALEVFSWLMDEVNMNNGCLITAYGELIHVFREKDFVDTTTGTFFDDDIDTWVSLETLALIGSLESELFRRFGWTLRITLGGDQLVVLAQMVASCGHTVSVYLGGDNQKTKSADGHITIDMYPIVTYPDQKKRHQNIVKDLWQGTLMPESTIFPVVNYQLVSSATPHLLHLQLPSEPHYVMKCLYGNWAVPSRHHAKENKNCLDI